MHDTGEMKRAQELRVDEFSVQKLRESHDTTQKLTSQLQSMQEQKNSMNDSGEFTAGSCLTFPVIQRFQVLVLRKAATNAYHLIHGMHLDYRKMFLVINFLHLVRRNLSQGIHYCATPTGTESVPQAIRTRTLFARDDKQIRDTIPMPTFAGRPSTRSSKKNSGYSAEFYG